MPLEPNAIPNPPNTKAGGVGPSPTGPLPPNGSQADAISTPVAGPTHSAHPTTRPPSIDDLFAPMPRRQRIGWDQTRSSTLSLPRAGSFKPPLFLVIWRLLLWSVTLAGFFGTLVVAKLLR